MLLNSPAALGLLIASIMGNFLALRGISLLEFGSRSRRWATALAIAANLAPFASLKIVQSGLPWLSDPAIGGGTPLAMPLGLAFYTFQQISFLVDAQRPDAERLGLVRFAAWSSFFAQLPAGPITTWRGMAPQYARLGAVVPPPLEVARGLTLVMAGIVKKIWIAGSLAAIVDPIMDRAAVHSLNLIEAWTAAWGYALQLYYDFSAYSDIALGLGLCFGLTLPINFNSPLKARSPGQYVMRWHISLMTFARDYIFAPTFRLARRLPITPTSRRYAVGWAIATLVAYLAIAAWHTLAPLPLLEGLAVSVTLILLQFARHRGGAETQSRSAMVQHSRRVAGRIAMLAGLSIFAVLLRTGAPGQLSRFLVDLIDLPSLFELMRDLVHYAAGVIGLETLIARPFVLHDMPQGQTRTLLTVVMASLIALTAPNTMQIFGLLAPGRTPDWLVWRANARWGWATAALLAITLLGITASTERAFIYERF